MGNKLIQKFEEVVPESDVLATITIERSLLFKF